MSDPQNLSVIYPMWVVTCPDCGPVCTVWEKPGTGCKRVEHCPACGRSLDASAVTRVVNAPEHERAMDPREGEDR